MPIRDKQDLNVVDKCGDLILEVGGLVWDDLSTQPDVDHASEVGSDVQQDAGRPQGRHLRQHEEPKPEDIVATECPPVRILVSSKVLTIGSPVFKKMLHGSFAEGRLHFSQPDPPTVSLLEDDPEATLLFCEITHYSRGVHHFKGYKALHGLAIFADKYDCTRSLRPWFHGQLCGFVGSGQDCFDTDALLQRGISVPQILKLCYLMNDADKFGLASKTFYTHISPLETRAKLQLVCEDEVPVRLVELLYAYGYHYIHELASIGPALIEQLSRHTKWYGYFTPIPKETTPETDDGDHVEDHAEVSGLCYGNIARIGILGATLTSLSLLPSNDPEINAERSPAAMLRKLRRLGEIDFCDKKLCCPKRARCSCNRDVSIKGELDKMIKAAQQKARCICLGCVKDGTRPITGILQDENPRCQRHAAWDE